MEIIKQNLPVIITGIIITFCMFGCIFVFLRHSERNEKSAWKFISFNRIKVGDTVRVAVGFSSYKNEGVVASKRKDTDGADYAWIDQINSRGEHYHSFTASASYCNFEIKK